MTQDLTQKYDLRVPRYTSYPTAPHFNDGVDGDVYRRWLGELDPAIELSLYFHIPFCDEMCWFCGCYTKIVKKYEPVMDYLTTLLAEIDLVADALPHGKEGGRMKARHLHWGGGSPTMLKGPDWMRIMDKLRERFDVVADAEVAVELDPRTATEDYVKALAAAGVNRASIGVQDYDDVVQKAINRIQPFEMTAQVIEWLRANGIERVNMDVMYGLPHQNMARIQDMVAKTISLKPARIALFGYAHVPWMKSHMKMINEADLPNAKERWEQFDYAANALVDAGYVRVGFDHFALPDDEMAEALAAGTLHRNFQGYTADDAPAMIGFGASAIGYLPQGYVQNESPLRTYKTMVQEGRLPIHRGFALKDNDVLRRDIIERLMCDMTVDLAHVCKTHGGDVADFATEIDHLRPLAADGLLTVDGTTITMTETGRPYVRLAAAAFDQYLKAGEQRHSRAV